MSKFTCQYDNSELYVDSISGGEDIMITIGDFNTIAQVILSKSETIKLRDELTELLKLEG